MAKSGWGNTNLISPDPYVARTGYGKVHNPNNPLSTDQYLLDRNTPDYLGVFPFLSLLL